MSSSSEDSKSEGTAYFYKCQRCRIKFHEDYIILPEKLCEPCLKLSKYKCNLCPHEGTRCTPWSCANKWENCSGCGNPYHEDQLVEGYCDGCY